ncbi:TetR/AcrR family transcriptional regulator [Amycolatopsis sp. lyj-112]|uniref:TetR/AcrR family transcriptional regulator n=1 Tax=Amycolatopsis sp. lyj-112 TaxID=2789288 RepID=UPI0039797BE1
MTTDSAREAPLGRRERHKRLAKQRLYDSALELFTDRGYEATTIEDIAERADVARGTFFNHFRRKEDLVSMWGEKRRQYLTEEIISTRPDTSFVAELENCMTALGKMNDSAWTQTRTMLLAWVKAGRPLLEEPYAADIFARIIETGIERGEVAATVDSHRVGNLLRDSYLGTLYRWTHFEHPPAPLAAELILVLHLILEGVLPRTTVAA